VLLEGILRRTTAFRYFGAVFALMGVEAASGADFDEAVAAHAE
jgi:hypothetical protein